MNKNNSFPDYIIAGSEATQSPSANRGLSPIVWGQDYWQVRELNSSLVTAYAFSEAKDEIPAGYHYILAEPAFLEKPGTSEAVVKALAWRIESTGYTCEIYQCQQPLSAMLDGESITAKEMTGQILGYSIPFEEWCRNRDKVSIKVREALEIAKIAIRLNPDEKLLELATLQERCGKKDSEWSKLMGKLEAEFRRELEKRQGISETTREQRLKLELQALIKEEDPIARTFKRNEICGRYSISARDIDNLLNSLDTANRTQKAKRLSAKAFLELEPEGLSWLVPGLLPSKGLTILAGDPGAGKTTLAYDLAAAVLTEGDEFLNEAPTRTGKVLFVASDELPNFIQDKFVNRGIFGSDNWEIILDWDVSQIGTLESTLEDFHPDLVIIDSFSSIHKDATFDENSAQARRSIVALETLLNRYNCSGLLIHHTNKSKDHSGVSKLRGSSAIAAAASVIWLLSGDSKSSIRNFSTPKIRGASPVNYQLALDAPNGRWQVISGDESEGINKSIGDRILEFMLADAVKKFTAEEIIGAVNGDKNSVYKALDRLTQRGILFKRPCKIDTRRKVYGLLDKTLTPPSPTVPDKLSTKFPETITTQRIEDSGQIVDTYSTDSGQGNDCLSNKIDETVTEQASQSRVDTYTVDRGGEVDIPLADISLSGADNSVSVCEPAPTPAPNTQYPIPNPQQEAPTPAPQQPQYKVGQRVGIHAPGLKRHGEEGIIKSANLRDNGKWLYTVRLGNHLPVNQRDFSIALPDDGGWDLKKLIEKP